MMDLIILLIRGLGEFCIVAYCIESSIDIIKRDVLFIVHHIECMGVHVILSSLDTFYVQSGLDALHTHLAYATDLEGALYGFLSITESADSNEYQRDYGS
jgi:hypothetical protein